MSTENKSCAPRLRFPGFTGEWKEQPLANFLFEHKTRSDGKCAVHSVSVSQGVVDQVKYLGRSFAAADTSKYNLAKPGDIIYTKSPTGAFPYGIIKQNKNPYNVIVSPLYAVYTPVTPYLGYILDSYFESPANTNNYLSSLVQKGAKNTINITNDTFVSKAVCLPTDPAEQKKIAECLAEMDKLIAAQGENVDALKEKKTGLMQQLFPQKGETIPRLRFPGFSGEWVEKKLGDIGLFIRGLSYNTSEVTQDTSSTLVIRSNNIIPDSIVDCKNGLVFVTKKPSKEQILKKGDVAICLANGSSNLVGKSSSFDGDYSGPITVGAFCGIYRSELPICKYLVQTAAYKEKINLIKQGGNGALANLYGKDILELSFYLPSLAEQQKIADCLSALDDQIAAESAKLEALKDQKTGLMQQLFPQPAK